MSLVTIWFSSFRSLVALRLFPAPDPRKRLALLLVVVLAGCGGGDEGEEPQTVTGSGYAFRAPGDWEVVRAGRTVTASNGDDAVSVTLFSLDRPFRPGLWRQVRKELDRVTGELARRLGATVDQRRDGRAAGRPARVYRLSRASDGTSRLAFVLDGRREYQLLCRGEAVEPCDQLLSTFTLT